MAVRFIAFHLTDRCNLNCQHCLRDPALKPKDLDPELLGQLLDQAGTVYGTRHVALTGGEPTIHPQFPRILDEIVSRGMTWHVVSNGSTFDRLAAWLDRNPLRREGMTALDLSLDGSCRATHDEIRGQGSFDVVLGAIAGARAREIPVVLQMTLNAKNLDQIESFGMLAAELDVDRISFCWMQPTGTHQDVELRLSPNQWRIAKDRVERLQGILRLPVGLPEGWPTSERFHTCEPFRSESLHVDVEGRLNLCCQHSGIPSAPGAPSDVVADLRETPLVEGHRRLVSLIHDVQQARLTTLAEADAEAGPRGEWDDFPCNNCLAHFGKPHWGEGTAVSGGQAHRPRWRGVWADGDRSAVRAAGRTDGKHRLHVL